PGSQSGHSANGPIPPHQDFGTLCKLMGISSWNCGAGQVLVQRLVSKVANGTSRPSRRITASANAPLRGSPPHHRPSAPTAAAGRNTSAILPLVFGARRHVADVTLQTVISSDRRAFAAPCRRL